MVVANHFPIELRLYLKPLPMRKFTLSVCCCLLLALFSYNPAKATGFIGGQITYTWVSDSTYQFSLNLYSPCPDSLFALPATKMLCYRNTCTGVSGNFILNKDTSIIQGMPPTPKHYRYSGNFTLPAKCTDWLFYIIAGQRNTTVNLATPSNLYLEAHINNIAASNSSSPYMNFSSFPICFNSPGYVFVKHIDNDSDSLGYEIVMPRQMATQTCSINDTATDVPYAAPYGLMHPATAAGNASISMPYLHFNAGADTGYFSFTVKVSEYRNGQLLGSVIEDIHTRIKLCNTPFSFNYGFDSANISGCQYIPATNTSDAVLKASVGVPFSICHYFVQPPNTTNHIGITYQLALTTFPNATVTNNATSPDSQYSCFSYTPTIADTGIKFIIVAFPDSIIQQASCYSYGGFISLTNGYYVHKIIISPTSGISAQIASSISVWPNPATNSINIKAPISTHASIMDIKGTVLMRETQEKEIDISSLPNGLYFLKITDVQGNFIKMEKVVKR